MTHNGSVVPARGGNWASIVIVFQALGNHFLQWDIIKHPDLALQNGKLPVFTGLGLGFELDDDAIERAKQLYADSLDLR